MTEMTATARKPALPVLAKREIRLCAMRVLSATPNDVKMVYVSILEARAVKVKTALRTKSYAVLQLAVTAFVMKVKTALTAAKMREEIVSKETAAVTAETVSRASATGNATRGKMARIVLTAHRHIAAVMECATVRKTARTVRLIVERLLNRKFVSAVLMRMGMA